MAKTKPGHRVVVHLDLRIALEAIIMNRLECIPTTRRQEWLRGLLVQGFRSECMALRGLPEKRESGSATAFTQWLAGESPRSVTSKAAPPSLQTRSAQAKADGKPFAALGKVIG
ncbi:MAG: hypothetical protein JAZ11_11155 [Candidatus Thiodiazotropha lotti]|nr:hypothetical protein [Candidatus Thiodiazotropha lotti]